MPETPPPFRAGFVAIIGRPNVGKSTLVNALLGQKIAAVSPRPQTTRRRQLGILTLEGAQVIFVDTPGLHVPRHKLGEFMNEEAAASLEHCDLIVWMVDTSEAPTPEDELIAKRLAKLTRRPAVLLVLNKTDRLKEDILPDRQAAFLELLPSAAPLAISAYSKEDVQRFLQAVVAALPPGGEPFFEEDQVTDLYEREIAMDLIRESALVHLRDEVPHALGVRIDEYKERSPDQNYIAATLLVERESHKGIVIGQGGEMLKRIGTTARKSIESMTGIHVYLELRVKVSKDWRDNPAILKSLGYRKTNS
jgi:GTP-binding protein Era